MPRKKKSDNELAPVDSVKIIEVRGERVVLDHDVAALFGTETKKLNQQVSRNSEKFGDDFAFRLTKEDFDHLRSQNVTSSVEWGGNRYPPRAFTEHGVVMAGTLLKTPRAIHATRLVVRTFVQLRHQVASKTQERGRASSSQQLALPLEFRTELMTKVANAIGQVLDAMVNPEEIKKARQEARGVITESVKGLKELLKKPSLENEKAVAEIRKLMAEAESIEVVTDGKRIENEERQLALLARKLNLIHQAQHFAQTGQTEGFMNLLGELDQKKLIGKS